MSEIPISENVARAWIDGRLRGREEERARIRGELWAWMEGGWREESFTQALDRVCPEEKPEK